jgi:hypothetical protein
VVTGNFFFRSMYAYITPLMSVANSIQDPLNGMTRALYNLVPLACRLWPKNTPGERCNWLTTTRSAPFTTNEPFGGHVGDLAQVDVLHDGLEILVLWVGAVELQLGLQRHAVGQTALDALVDAVSGRIDEVIQELQHELVAGVRDGEILTEHLEKAFALAMFGEGLDLEEVLKTLQLDIEKVGISIDSGLEPKSMRLLFLELVFAWAMGADNEERDDRNERRIRIRDYRRSNTWIKVEESALYAARGVRSQNSRKGPPWGLSVLLCASAIKCLLDLNFCAGFRELLLQALSVLFRDTFLQRLWSTVHEVFRLFQSQSGELLSRASQRPVCSGHRLSGSHRSWSWLQRHRHHRQRQVQRP